MEEVLLLGLLLVVTPAVTLRGQVRNLPSLDSIICDSKMFLFDVGCRSKCNAISKQHRASLGPQNRLQQGQTPRFGLCRGRDGIGGKVRTIFLYKIQVQLVIYQTYFRVALDLMWQDKRLAFEADERIKVLEPGDIWVPDLMFYGTK